MRVARQTEEQREAWNEKIYLHVSANGFGLRFFERDDQMYSKIY